MGVPFASVLIANRGEIAVRIKRACRELGLRPVLIASEADKAGGAVPDVDGGLVIGPSAPGRSYLNQAALLLAARVTGAEAVHPGYGFLSENAEFAEVVEAAGLTFVGPPASVIRIMGDKIAAKRAMMAAGVPCVPGPVEPLPDNTEAVRAIAEEIGYPVIVKAAGGGGGRGMRVVRESAELVDAIAITREEARRAFGKPELYTEKFLEHPRHVEFQVLCDNHGNAVWVGHRDCSVQRRHQKVVEEAPAPGIAPELAERIGARCVEACRQIGYRGVGTFEFLYENGEFYFIEMNTRLQVEHPVTEMTAGIDLVHEQLRAAQGAVLETERFASEARGHAFESRINAEDPTTFVASPGRITAVRFPSGPGIRVDTHVSAGYHVSPYYDSLIAKLIVHAPTREDAIRRMQVALSETRIEGIATNLALHARIFSDPDFVRGGVDIHHLEQRLMEEPVARRDRSTSRNTIGDLSDPALISTLTGWLESSGARELEIATPDGRLKIALDAGSHAAAIAHPTLAMQAIRPKALAVKATIAGLFRDRHPAAPEAGPLAGEGRALEAGAIVGFVEVGPVLLAVVAPHSGLVGEINAHTGELIGYGDAVLTMEPSR